MSLLEGAQTIAAQLPCSHVFAEGSECPLNSNCKRTHRSRPYLLTLVQPLYMSEARSHGMDAQRPQRRILPCRAPRPGRISSGAALRRPSTPINIFRFLDLPGELRNAVYEEIAASTDTVVFRNGSPVPPPLSRVCRQVRSEFLSVLNSDVFSPTTVDMKVKDFDFASVYATIKQMMQIIPPPGQKLRLNVLIDRLDHARRRVSPLAIELARVSNGRTQTLQGCRPERAWAAHPRVSYRAGAVPQVHHPVPRTGRRCVVVR